VRLGTAFASAGYVLAQVRAKGKTTRRNGMTRTVFAMAAAALLMAAVSGTSQAVPIAPPAGNESADQGNLTPVYWYHRHHYWHRHHRHCWRGRWGRVHCRWW
jgi:hypothetical protein